MNRLQEYKKSILTKPDGQRGIDSSIFYIKEFQYRMAYAFLGTALFLIVSYNFKQEVIYYFLPQGLSYFVSGGLVEVFDTYMNLCVYLTILVGLNLAALQTLFFLRPALYNYESYALNLKFWGYLTLSSFVFSLISPFTSQIFWDAFSYICKFFLPANSTLEPKIANYIRNLQELNGLLSFALPIIVLLKLLQQFTTPESWTKYRGLVYIISTVFGALITPPDLSSQLMIAMPIIFFYESQLFYWKLDIEYKNTMHARGLL